MAAKFVGEAFVSGAIQVLVERIASPEVVNYFLGNKHSDFEGLLKKLKAMVTSLTAVLDDAELRQMRNDPSVESWLGDIQEALFDADDLLDDIETHALQLSEVREAKRRKIFDFFSRFRISNERDVESKIMQILDRMEEITKQKDLIGLRENSAVWQRLPSTSLMIEESEFYGRDDDKEDVIKLLVSDGTSCEKICVIPVVGMGGVGKTTLAQAVFNDGRVKEHFDIMSWVCVSEDFDACRVTSTLLQPESSTFSGSSSDLNSLQVKLRQKLSRKRFLIVLDDVWNERYVDWEVMKLPFNDGAKGSKIIVTTRSEEVASIMGTRTIPTRRLNALAEEASWQLFVKHAFGDFSANPALEGIGRAILKKCKGLPLAIKTLGGLLRSKLDIDHWDGILKSEIWELTDKQSDILPALRLSYHYLPSHLKRCFAYCSIFPKDYQFDKEELILLWMAENLLEKPKGSRSLEEVGSQYFDHLVSWSFFQRSSTTYRSFFVMHDLIVDLANFVSGEYCFRLESGNSYKAVTKKMRYLACIGNQSVISERFISVLKATRLRTLLLHNCEGHDSEPMLHDFFMAAKYLRVLSFSGHHGAKGLVDSVCKLRHLRFLNLFSISLNILPDSICTLYNLQTLKLIGCPLISKLPNNIHHLVNLRYLNASFTSLEELPESLGLLSNLQTLILSNCSKLTKLPSSLHCLTNLRCLDVQDSGLKEMPTQLSNLQSLHTLSTFVVGNDSGAKIRELKKLSTLKGTLCITNLQNMVNLEDALEAKLKQKKYLEKLKFEWTSQQTNDSIHELGQLDNLMPNTALKKLEIFGYGGMKFPDWLGHQSFCNIVDVCLLCCHSSVTLPPLGQLSSLKKVVIGNFEAVVTVGVEFYGSSSSIVKPFASLEVLEFDGMPNWKEWTIPDEDFEAFPKLRELSLLCCESLRGDIPCFLPSLKELTMYECHQFSLSLQRIPSVTKLKLFNCSENIIRSMEELESSICLQNLIIAGNSLSLRFRCLPTSLKSLSISSDNSIELQLLQQPHNSLENLSIQCYNCSFIPSFALDNFPNIRFLSLEGCENTESLWVSSNGQSLESLNSLSTLRISNSSSLSLVPNNTSPLTSLTYLDVSNCKELKSLPEQMHNLLPSLDSLDIRDCSELESFPILGLPSGLRQLCITNSDKLIASRRSWNLQRLPNLVIFKIWQTKCEDMKSFPEGGLLPSSVTQLEIGEIECLKSLDSKGLQQLNSLEQLCISNCSSLQTLPEEGLPESLLSLKIIGCPLLEEKCRRTGEYWSKISNIPYIQINL